MALTDFTLSNARRFYSSKGNPLGVKGLKVIFTSHTFLCDIDCQNNECGSYTSAASAQMFLVLWILVSHDHRSFERNFRNCEQKPEKVRTSTGFEPVTSRYRCDALTNWAMKPLTLGAGHLWVLMSPWRMDVKWYMKCFIYWTADLKSSKPWSSQFWTGSMIIAVLNRLLFAIA